MLKLTTENYCRFNYDEELCLSSIYAYQKELDLIYEKTGKQYEVIMTNVGYTLPHDILELNFLFNYLKEDPNIKTALIFLANGWSFYENSNWLDIETEQLKPIASELNVCS